MPCRVSMGTSVSGCLCARKSCRVETQNRDGIIVLLYLSHEVCFVFGKIICLWSLVLMTTRSSGSVLTLRYILVELDRHIHFCGGISSTSWRLACIYNPEYDRHRRGRSQKGGWVFRFTGRVPLPQQQ